MVIIIQPCTETILLIIPIIYYASTRRMFTYHFPAVSLQIHYLFYFIFCHYIVFSLIK